MLCLFDIDGTLISGGGSGRRAFEAACHALLGIERALAAIKLDGMTDPLILAHVFEHHLGRTPSAAEEAQIFARYLDNLDGEVARSTQYVLGGVERALAVLEGRGATIGLATGNLQGGARIKLTHSQLWHRFPFGGFGCDAADRGALVRIARQRGEARAGRNFARREVLVIGDTPKDIAAAHAADATAVGVATGGFSVAELQAAGADFAYASLDEWIAASPELGA